MRLIAAPRVHAELLLTWVPISASLMRTSLSHHPAFFSSSHFCLPIPFCVLIFFASHHMQPKKRKRNHILVHKETRNIYLPCQQFVTL
ncbi:hypothetical protein VTJ04DRAFT_752 [Mycothermus thermophilus]|uniref:uncharacterized protein n=1 Tax=Humicola insolens TaxID=85995 RepID=UPI00374358A8